ncbi:ankyrin repeat domain-containing protein [Pseudomonas luteola]
MMEIYDKKSEELTRLYDIRGIIGEAEFGVRIDSYINHKRDSLISAGKNFAGNMIMPYLLAMKYGYKDVMDKLVQSGFNPSYELLYKHSTILVEYIENTSNIDPSIVSAHIEHVKSLYIDQPADVSRQRLAEYLCASDPFNRHDAVFSLVKRSSSNGYEGSQKILRDVVKLLVDNGSSLNRRDNNNYTPLQWAIIEGNNRLAINLIRTMDQAALVGFNNNGETALSLAAKGGHYEVVVALLKRGCMHDGVNLRQAQKASFTLSMEQKLLLNNPLMLSLKNGHTKVAKELVLNGGNFDSSNNPHDMHSPLIYAVKQSDHDLVDAMIKSGFNVNEQNSHGFTPLLYAVLDYSVDQQDSIKKIINSLISAKANFDILGRNGVSATDVLEKISSNSLPEVQEWMFIRNTAKLKDFVFQSTGLDLKSVKDIVINDDHRADMRIHRIENINSVWLNREEKSDEFKSSLSEKGFAELKKLSGALTFVGGGTYSGLQFAKDYAGSHAWIAANEAVKLATSNIEFATLSITVLTAAVSSIALMTDDAKRYAVSIWIKGTLQKIKERLVDPVMDKLEHLYEKKYLEVINRIRKIEDKLDIYIDRLSRAYRSLKGDYDSNEPNNTTNKPDIVEKHEVPARKVKQANKNQSIGMK